MTTELTRTIESRNVSGPRAGFRFSASAVETLRGWKLETSDCFNGRRTFRFSQEARRWELSMAVIAEGSAAAKKELLQWLSTISDAKPVENGIGDLFISAGPEHVYFQRGNILFELKGSGGVDPVPLARELDKRTASEPAVKSVLSLLPQNAHVYLQPKELSVGGMMAAELHFDHQDGERYEVRYRVGSEPGAAGWDGPEVLVIVAPGGADRSATIKAVAPGKACVTAELCDSRGLSMRVTSQVVVKKR